MTLTVRQVAEVCGVHPETVREWIRARRLVPLPLPRKPYRVPAEELVRLGYKKALERAGYKV